MHEDSVGKVTAAKMRSIGLFTGADLKRLTEAEMTRHFGKTGKFFYGIVRGIDHRPVRPNREIKSVSVEDTYPEDLVDHNAIRRELEALVDRLQPRLHRRGLQGRTVTLKFKFHDFAIMTRSLSTPTLVTDKRELLHMVFRIFEANETALTHKHIRLLGVGVSNFAQGLDELDRMRTGYQLRLFGDAK